MEDTGVSGAEAGGIDIKTYFPFLRQFGNGGKQSVLANHVLTISRVSFCPISPSSLFHTEKNEDVTREDQHYPDGKHQLRQKDKNTKRQKDKKTKRQKDKKTKRQKDKKTKRQRPNREFNIVMASLISL